MAYLLLVEVDNLVNTVDNFFRKARICYSRVGHPHRPRNGNCRKFPPQSKGSPSPILWAALRGWKRPVYNYGGITSLG